MLIAVLEIAGDLRHHQLHRFALKIDNFGEKLASLWPFQRHDTLTMPGDMDSTIFRLSICKNIFVEPIAFFYLVLATT